jgi:hypothetical protein
MIEHPQSPTSASPVLRCRPAVFAVALLLAAFAVVGRPGAQNDTPREPQAVADALQRHGLRDPVRLQRRGGVWVAEVAAIDGSRYRAVVDAETGELTGLRALPPVPPRSQGDAKAILAGD